ncbi:unnamed protein product [Tuber melanosporum]|uniref:(Perigord truffle) hypothetical protein n=1 Tax=Tuber melanosporum (strain Mel28) TaxID=656061 RepID=D5GAL3_TUBMM|nr:uncharacterized protein GSTUM_00003669001 [Tuber melanosporum]CAZ81556.1 unnamed protein product [Tuber melanosporum]
MAYGPSNETKKQYLSLNLHFPQPILPSQAPDSSFPPFPSCPPVHFRNGAFPAVSLQ